MNSLQRDKRSWGDTNSQWEPRDWSVDAGLVHEVQYGLWK